MKTDKGTLKKTKNGFIVTVPSKKGTVDKQIPQTARCFRDEDAADGLEVVVVRDDKDLVVEVTIPGKPKVPPPPAGKPQAEQAKRSGPRGGRSKANGGRGRSQPRDTARLPKAAPRVLGLAFHNPYTFLPFPEETPLRRDPTPLSIDELPEERGRLTGVLEVEVVTESPLLTCHPEPIDEDADTKHKTYRALTIGPDVILPATGIRGALRTLLTVLTGGTLGYLNQHAYLCQDRDVNLGPGGAKGPADTPKNVFLAEVVRPGTSERPGTVRLGETRLVEADDLRQALQKAKPELRSGCQPYQYGSDPLPRKVVPSRKQSIFHLWAQLDAAGKVVGISDDPEAFSPAWKVKLSGPPVRTKAKSGGKPAQKREGLFLRDRDQERTLTLPAELWGAYSGRNLHGDRPALEQGDLVWLEPADPNAEEIVKPEDVKSIQWARWGRQGQALKDKVPKRVWPDDLQGDGRVDEVTDLFGQVPSQRNVKAPAFAARLRPENLVFRDAASKVERVTLAPLAVPHPGCIAFYRKNPSADEISSADDLRGYKVYRTTQERDEKAPWRYEVQGIYDPSGSLRPSRQTMNKTCDLVPEGTSGMLRIAFRGLSLRELALLVQACHVPWRLGGGKPLGLGLCRVRVKGLIGEDGELLQVPGWTLRPREDSSLEVEGWQSLVADLGDRVRMWEASQAPVTTLRYPRAVEKNQFGIVGGGHVWFKRHAAPRKGKPGLEPIYIDGELKAKAEEEKEPLDPQCPMIRAQVLPAFDPAQPQADALYGYDGFATYKQDDRSEGHRTMLQIEPFDPNRHAGGAKPGEGNQGKDRTFRKDQKRRRKEDP